MKKNLMKYTAIFAAVGTLTLGSITAYGESVSSSDVKVNATETKANKVKFADKAGGVMIKEDLSGLVEKNIIDQATADKIKAYRTEKAEEMKVNMEKVKNMTEAERTEYFKTQVTKEPYADLVSAGIITQAQADQIKAEMPTHRVAFMKQGFDLDALVKNNTIDQATADKVKAYMESKMQEMKSKMSEKPSDQTVKTERTDILTDLVTEGILTQSQADAIKATMPERKMSIKLRLDAFVEDGTITKETAAKIETYLAGLTINPEDKIDIFESLVKEGIITQEQADKIKTHKGEKGNFVMKADFSGLVENNVVDQATADKMAAYVKEKAQTLKTSEIKEMKQFDIFGEMLNDGVITQSQYDAIKASKTGNMKFKVKN